MALSHLEAYLKAFFININFSILSDILFFQNFILKTISSYCISIVLYGIVNTLLDGLTNGTMNHKNILKSIINEKFLNSNNFSTNQIFKENF